MTKSCFFLAADARYFPYACLAARRVLDVSLPIDGFILQMNVGVADLAAAQQLLDDRVRIVDLSELMRSVTFAPGHLSIAVYMRLFIDEISEFAPYERVAYLDSDVLFNRSIVDLVETPLDAPLLAAHDVQSYFEPKYRALLSMKPGAPYFNSGVLSLDLPRIRKDGLLARARYFASRGVNGLDQGALNVAFEGKWQTMHPSWNVMTSYNWQVPFEKAYARHFSWGKPWDKVPLGVELAALDIYRDLAKNTRWWAAFQRRVPFERGVMKRFVRRFDTVGSLLTSRERIRRRARYDGERVHEMFARQAEEGAMAAQFPEVLGGFG
ncbi:hypothetical protein EH240_29325 [Mesorhizobium tamadayense]|uniref:Glycosyltransferase family 8 protein n=1 Tax=Mesorhizobium tamadayense TaxID=425306 RepID=A0A3P3F5K8_9HYPH|nr:glycosyltransferase [Mesorhizobium tamadayense]RRH93526.1 hypothetical protein EH240_29325 [Mesorhizobium tamadayense]